MIILGMIYPLFYDAKIASNRSVGMISISFV